MSGARPQHLQLRHGTYHLRVRVPDDLRARVGLSEVRRSLNAHTLSTARPLALKYAARLMEVFQMLRESDISKEHARRWVAKCFADMAADAEKGFRPETADPERELEEQLSLWEDVVADVKDQLEQNVYSGPVETTCRMRFSRSGLDWGELDPGIQTDLLHGTARALLEQHRLLLFRLTDRLTPYKPLDPLFADSAMVNAAHSAVSPPSQQSVLVGPTMRDAADRYLAYGKQRWTGKTLKSRRVRIEYLVEHIGPSVRLGAVTADHVRSFRDAVSRLRNTRSAHVGSSFVARQTDNQDHWIAPKTAALIFETAKSFFNWATDMEGFIKSNPAHKIVLDVPKGKKVKKPRRPFNPEELAVLFSSPVFTGCLSGHRRYEPGDMVIRDDKFWIPLLGLFTGARLGELVQLHLGDVHLDGPIPYITITDENGGDLGTDSHKSVKTHAGVRDIPLHPDLMALGFAHFIERVRKEKRPTPRVFWRTAHGRDGQASTVFSKWFARLLDKSGLTDPALVFHSFRHNAEDSFRNALLPQKVIDRIIGHTDGDTSDGYGAGLWLETSYEAVKAMKLRVKISDHIPQM